ncbi:MAG TPA: flagellar motor switch protein FliN [Gaiellaceae bacterium]|jgi:flagellar motor switch protein FliN/FliY
MSDAVLTDAGPATTPVSAPAGAGGGELAYEEIVARAASGSAEGDLSLVFDLPVELAVEIGRTTMTIRETLAIGPGSLIQLNRLAGEPVDLLVNGHRIARGEVVAIDEEFGLRVTEIITPDS